MEVVGRQPLCILDGAHNPAGARAAAATLAEEFAAARSCVLVLGVLRGRDPLEMLKALGDVPVRLVVACPPPSPRALPTEEVVAAAGQLGLESTEATSVAEAVELALAEAGPDELVFVTGSLYVVGAARAVINRVSST
jgi:dihydrofolate synthase/folylpolyglutamate synthase